MKTAGTIPDSKSGYLELGKLQIRYPSQHYFFRMQGDSMRDAFIPDQAMLLIDTSIKPQSGMIVLLYGDAGYKVRRLVKTNRCWVLHAENATYRPQPIDPETRIQICGIVTGIIIQPYEQCH